MKKAKKTKKTTADEAKQILAAMMADMLVAQLTEARLVADRYGVNFHNALDESYARYLKALQGTSR